VAEGADIIMVKPALPYLDILADASRLAPDHPLACYQVSGEFAMIVAGANAGVYDLRTMAFESTQSMLRAGAFGLFSSLFFSVNVITHYMLCRSYAYLDLLHARLFRLARYLAGRK
jgi:delta-aminolevulinic acid dehydratase/porphobilinogen synthase